MAEKITAPEETQESPTIALLFELENVGFQGRQVVFDVLKSVLADKDMKLTPVLFSRCCVDKPVEEALPQLLELLGHPRVSSEKLVPEIAQGIRASLVDNTPKSPAALGGLLKQAQDEGYKIGVVSDMDQDAALQLYAKLDIGEPEDGAVITSESETGTADSLAWKAAARAMDALIPSCVVLATSSRSAHAAVAAGMRCLVIPDEYTSFQDFGGADRILDGLDDGSAKEILDTLAVHP
jgi:putative hydrolase of the HAD superfamily